MSKDVRIGDNHTAFMLFLISHGFEHLLAVHGLVTQTSFIRKVLCHRKNVSSLPIWDGFIISVNVSDIHV